MLTNPPPSSGGILIAFALELLERADGPVGAERLVEVMDAAQRQRTREFVDGLYEDGFARSFLAADRLGSTTHITAIDADGTCAAVTCSNGTGSGVIVPGTGLHVNNMLGEQDLNPLGFHRHPAGRRVPSMMSPTVILRDGELEAGLGSAGSNRIRSAILQTIVRLVSRRLRDRGSGQRAARALRVRRGPGRARDRRGARSTGWPSAVTGSFVGRITTSSSAASTPSLAIRPRADSPAPATRGGVGRWRSPERSAVGSAGVSLCMECMTAALGRTEKGPPPRSLERRLALLFRAERRPGMNYVGIDWAYRRAAWCALSEGGRIEGEGMIPADEGGLARLVLSSAPRSRPASRR